MPHTTIWVRQLIDEFTELAGPATLLIIALGGFITAIIVIAYMTRGAYHALFRAPKQTPEECCCWHARERITLVTESYQTGVPIELDARERLLLIGRLTAEQPATHADLAKVVGVPIYRLKQIESKLMSKLRTGLAVEYPEVERQLGERWATPRRVPD